MIQQLKFNFQGFPVTLFNQEFIRIYIPIYMRDPGKEYMDALSDKIFEYLEAEGFIHSEEKNLDF